MKKRGFTLIEILAVIVIIALILVLVTPNILANLSKARGKVSDATEKVIEQATNIYLDENPDTYPENEGDIYCITVDTLMGAGKLVNPLTDAATGKEIDGSTSVRVTITKGGREYELVTDGTCNQGNLDILTSEQIGISVSNITTKGFDVTTTIPEKYKENIGRYDYSIDGGKKYDYKNRGSNTRITNLLTNTYTIKVKVTTKDGQVVVGSKAVKATLIPIGDITFKSAPGMNVCAPSKVITVTNPASTQIAIAKNEKLMYSYTLNTALNKNSWPKQTNNIYNLTVTDNGTLMARVTDGVNEKVVSYAITKVAAPNPVVLKATVDLTKEKWYAGRITVTARTSVCTNKPGIKINGYCLTTTNSRPSASNSCFNNTGSNNHSAHNNNSFGRDNGTYYAWVRDTAGNVSLKGVKVTVNWKGKPSCTINRSGKYINGNSKWWTGNVTATLKPSGNGKTIRSKSISSNGSSSSTKVTVKKEGKSTVSGVVKAGGKTGKCSYTAWIDKTSPSCSATALGNNTTNPRVKFSCSDKTSGCTSSGTTKYGGGTHSYTCKDNAGHTKSVSKYVKLYIPPPPPPPPPPSSGGGSSGGSGSKPSTPSISCNCRFDKMGDLGGKISCSANGAVSWKKDYGSFYTSCNSTSCTIGFMDEYSHCLSCYLGSTKKGGRCS